MNHNLEPTQKQSARKDFLTVMLILFGVASLLFIGIGLILEIDNLKGIGVILAMAYLLVLIWWLAHSHPRVNEKPDFSPIINLSQTYWVGLGLVSISAGSAFVLTGMVMSNGWLMFPWSTLLAILVLIVLRQQITQKVVLAASIIFILFFRVEFIFPPDNVKRELINALLIAFQAGAGILLLNHTRLTKIRLDFDRQFDQWWKAFYALQPGRLEEPWACLFLLTFFYALLGPTSPQQPQRALTAALIISVFIHGSAHYPQALSNPASAIFIALIYGIPLGLIYIKRDYESAVGYHFFVDFVRFAFTASLIN